MRVGFRTLFSLVLCAAAAGAAFAHAAIDLVGDYALAHDTYDHLHHASRELVSGVALVLAGALAARGLRICLQIAAANRTRVLRPVLRRSDFVGFIAGAVVASALAVPAMEWLDGRLAGMPVRQLDDAFGGSILLGLAMTLFCTSVTALVAYGILRWLISHRDSIATILEILCRRLDDRLRPCRYDLARQLVAPRRRRTPHALRLSKRGPPQTLPV